MDDDNSGLGRVECEVIGLAPSISQQGKTFSLVLKEVKGERKIPILIGFHEGQAIAVVLEKLVPARPLTHDLFTALLQQVGATLEEVFIHTVTRGIIYSRLLVKMPDGKRHEVEARPSDAIAVAVRVGCPIFCSDTVLREAAVVESIETIALKKSSFAEYSLDELTVLLASVLAKEDYASAARLRDVIEKRKQAGE